VNYNEIKGRGLVTIVMLVAVCLLPAAVRGEYGRTASSEIDPEIMKIDEEKYLGAPVAGDYRLSGVGTDSATLGDLMVGKPLVLLLSYYNCDGVCPTVNRQFRDLVAGMKKVKVGDDFRVLTLSFDKNDTSDTLKMFNKELDLPDWMEKGWTTALLEGEDEIRRLTESVGYRFFWSKRDQMFLHPNVFVFLSPEGRVVRYLYGATMGEQDVELAITEASFGKSGKSKVEDLKDILLIACYSYNYKEGKYSLNYPLFFGLGSLFIGISTIFISLIIVKKRVRR